MSRWAWLATFAIGCGHPTPPPAAPQRLTTAIADAGVDAPLDLDDDLPRLADRAVRLYLDWQRAFADVGIDCATATARMNALADANADLIEANRRLIRAPHAKKKAVQAELQKREAEIDPAAKAIIESPVMSKCSTDAGFGKAVDRLAGEG